jgi:hypothetical protein
MTNNTVLSIQKGIITLGTLPQIVLFPTVCENWTRLQWGSLKRLHTNATVWVQERFIAVLEIWKHKPLHRRRPFGVDAFTSYNCVFEKSHPFLFHHNNDIINSTGQSFLSNSSASHKSVFHTTCRFIHNSSTLGPSLSPLNVIHSLTHLAV